MYMCMRDTDIQRERERESGIVRESVCGIERE